MHKKPLSGRIQQTSSILHWTLVLGIIALAGFSLHNYTQDKSLGAKFQKLQSNRQKLNNTTLGLEQKILQIKAFKQINQKSQINSMHKNKRSIFFESRKDRLTLLEK